MAESEETVALLNEEEKTLDSETYVKIKVEHDDINEQSSLNPLSIFYKLDEGKKFHLFVSHSNVDYEFVKVIVKTLEKDYNIRCMVAGQEFVGGTPIDENIISRMEESMKVLIVLTPNYTESGWCQYEQRMIFIMSLTNQNNCIIPLMLEPCNIPNTLKGLTYIDASKESDIPAKIMEAFRSNDCMSGFAPDLIAQIKAEQRELLTHLIQKQNGRTLLQIYAKEVKKNCSFSRMEFQLTPEDENALLQDEVHTNGGLHDIIEELNSSLYIQNFNRWYTKKHLFALICLAIMAVFFFCISVFLMVSIVMESFDSAGIFLFIVLPTFVLLTILATPIIRNCLRVHLMSKTCVCVFKHVQRFYKKAKIFVYFRVDGPMLHIIRYDTEPCQKFLKNMLQELNRGLTDIEIERKVDFMIEETIWNYQTEICTSKCEIPDSPVNRHNTYNSKKCLCQIIEPTLRVNQPII